MPAWPLPPPHLEHGAVLEDVLLVAHHAVLVERWDALLRVLHDLRGRMWQSAPWWQRWLGHLGPLLLGDVWDHCEAPQQEPAPALETPVGCGAVGRCSG